MHAGTRRGLETHGITMRYPGVVALDDVSLSFRPGEVHALCGENGAGKSTLIKILSGVIPAAAYEGRIELNGEPFSPASITGARGSGIAVIHQELALIAELTVAENVFLGREPTRRGLVDFERLFSDTEALFARLGLDISASAPVRALGIGSQQLVEIAKALSFESSFLLLDEPTAALTDREVAKLHDVVRELRASGTTCVYITHRLDEVFTIADRVSVLRDGTHVMTEDVSSVDEPGLIRSMVGREIADLYPRRAASADTTAAPRTPADRTSADRTPTAATPPARMPRARTPEADRARLELVDVTVARGLDDTPVLEGIDLAVHAGEVVGIGGLMGAGRTELALHLIGAFGRRLRGTMRVDGREVVIGSPSAALDAGIMLVSEDRKRYGLFGNASVRFNLTIASLASVVRFGLVDEAAEGASALGAVRDLGIKTPTIDAGVLGLSGGNQQRVVLGRAVLSQPGVFLLDEPTRGVDVGAKREIYEIVNALTDRGKAVVLISSELPELIGMSDRIVVLSAGRVGGTFARGEATEEAVLSAAMRFGSRMRSSA